MFLDFQARDKINYYQEMLMAIGSLSRLFSESNEPFIQYRVAENLFCQSFDAENLSRTDCSADAKKNKLGIGIKTFLEKNGATMQKVAEFNSEHKSFSRLNYDDRVRLVSKLRNERIETTKRIFGLDNLIYHCVTRKETGILVYETPMDIIELDKIKNISQNKNIIFFKDGLNEYSFNITKSTLYKRFLTKVPLLDFSVEILEKPFGVLESLFKKAGKSILFSPLKAQEHIFLPLYSGKNGEKTVWEKSGLNQWNASGRSRDPNEVYIPIPAQIHKKHPGFFPPRDSSFTLILPDGSEMSAKVCQDNSKALMSDPNSALGKWILRNVLKLKERELLTYEKLRRIGLDSVVIYKADEGKYDIDFTKTGSYEKFMGVNTEVDEDEFDV